jgi:hypothetical protein
MSEMSIDDSSPGYASCKLQDDKANALRQAALQAMAQGLQFSSNFEPRSNGPSQIKPLDPRASTGTKDSYLGKSKRTLNPMSDDDSEDEIVLFAKPNKKKSAYEGISQNSTRFRTDTSSSNQTAMVLQAKNERINAYQTAMAVPSQNQRPNSYQTPIAAPTNKQKIFVWETENHSRSSLFADQTNAELAPVKRIQTEYSFVNSNSKNNFSMKSNIELIKYCEAKAGNEYPVYINPNNEIRILEQIFP